jgi:hypothetical protein
MADSAEFIPHLNGDGAPPLTSFVPGKDWGPPDPRLSQGATIPAPKLDLRHFRSLGPFIEQLGAAKSCAPDYAALALLVTASGVVGAARGVSPRPGWREPCGIYGMLVGPPSNNKSGPLQAFKVAAQFLEREENSDFQQRQREYETEVAMANEIHAAWEQDVKEARKSKREPPIKPVSACDPVEPKPRRIVISNITTEALNGLFAANLRGLVMLQDEGSGFLGSFERYNKGSDAHVYLSAYNGIAEVTDRLTRGTINPPHAWLSIGFGIQPEKLVQLALDERNRTNDGLVSRFLYVWPNPVPPVWKVAPCDEGRIVDTLRRLRSLKMGSDGDGQPAPRYLRLAPEAEELFGAWWADQKIRGQSGQGYFAEFLGKSLGGCARLALALELLEWAQTDDGPSDGPAAVSLKSTAHAIALFRDYFEPMAARVFGDAGSSGTERAAISLVSELRKRGARQFNASTARMQWKFASCLLTANASNSPTRNPGPKADENRSIST